MSDVSVVVPTFNRLEYLKAAIGSCFEGNDNINVQIVVVDDGSTDGTRDWLTALDPRVAVVLSDHAGGPAARNAGLRHASSPYIKFLDDDDMLVPGSLAKQLDHIGKSEPSEIPYGRVEWIDERGNRFGETAHRVRRASEDPLLHVMYNNIMTAAPLHRKEALLKVGGFDETLECQQEYDLHLRLTANGYRFKFFDHVVYRQRHHSSLNRISNVDRITRDPMFAMKLLDARLQMLETATHGQVQPAWIVGLSRIYWNYGRQLIRLGDHPAAKRYFVRARELAGSAAIADPWYYRFITRLAGPWWAEWISRRWVSLLNRAPLDALDRANRAEEDPMSPPA